ncbi:origin recognition complex subunit 5 C-terminus-domain-containing protein [Limtongia smithiae]|uniref:origin recognition complex subunit 5 C-terminus-domain-containing protein n=1 Tax=Limtongia smithiae TaxID=1125753 RepID=UPI0034CEA6C8
MENLSAGQLDELALANPARFYQLESLNSLLTPDPICNPPVIELAGQKCSGKSRVLRQFLEKTQASFSWIQVDECVSLRMLLQRIAVAIRALSTRADPLGSSSAAVQYSISCLNSSALVEQANDALATVVDSEPHFIVLDRIDELSEQGDAFFQFITKISEFLNSDLLTFILVSSSSNDPRRTLTTPFPHIYFPAYSKSECIAILHREPLTTLRKCINAAVSGAEATKAVAIPDEENLSLLWTNFCQILVDTFFPLFGPDIRQLQTAARKAFLIYVGPVLDGSVKSYTNATYRLYKQNQHLLTSEDIVRNSLVSYLQGSAASYTDLTGGEDMPVFSKYLLCAAYLASYTKQKFDARLFSRIGDGIKRRKSRAKKGGRDKINGRSLAPSAFEYERLLAIARCIIPVRVESTIDLQTQLTKSVQFATLVTLRLILRSGASVNGEPAGGGDILESRTRWKVNVSWDIILQVSRDIKFQIEHYILE